MAPPLGFMTWRSPRGCIRKKTPPNPSLPRWFAKPMQSIQRYFADLSQHLGFADELIPLSPGHGVARRFALSRGGPTPRVAGLVARRTVAGRSTLPAQCDLRRSRVWQWQRWAQFYFQQGRAETGQVRSRGR